MAINTGKLLSAKEQNELLQILKQRFNQFPLRHPYLHWQEVEQQLMNKKEKLWSLQAMEKSGGEPDVINLDAQSKDVIFIDCAPESPKGRRSLCYDEKALKDRKEAKPLNCALSIAQSMGIELLNEEEYKRFQQSGPFDQKTSSWLLTPTPIRQLGGAIFGDFRYGQVFIYHNGAQSYYANRGFRGLLRI